MPERFLWGLLSRNGNGKDGKVSGVGRRIEETEVQEHSLETLKILRDSLNISYAKDASNIELFNQLKTLERRIAKAASKKVIEDDKLTRGVLDAQGRIVDLDAFRALLVPSRIQRVMYVLVEECSLNDQQAAIALVDAHLVSSIGDALDAYDGILQE